MAKCISCEKESQELNENNVCPDCIEEVENIIDEVVEAANNDNNTPNENLDDTPNDNFEVTVTKRNEMAEEAKEELTPPVEEDEKEPKKGKYIKFGLLCVGVGFIGYGVLGALKAHKQAQNPTVEQPLG